MKKWLSLLLALAMIVSLSIPTLAVDTITSTESGSNSSSQNVTGNYTPTEAKWGKSKDDLNIGSGTLAEALEKAATNSEIKYIQLQNNATEANGYYIYGGSFILDLNGKTVNSDGYTITIGDNVENAESSVDVTFTDSGSGGKVETTGLGCSAIAVKCGKATFAGGTYYRLNMSHSGYAVPYANVTIDGGNFTANDVSVVRNDGGTLTIKSGTISGLYAVNTSGTTTITGGTFTASNDKHIYYDGGKLDLSGYDTANTSNTALTDLVVANYTDAAVTVGDTTIKLPSGYGFYKSNDTSKTTVTTLAADAVYAIQSTGGSTTTDEAKWGKSKDDLNIGSGTLKEALEKAAASNEIKYIQLQKDPAVLTSSYAITGGVFTLDLNGHLITSAIDDGFGTIEVSGSNTNVTFADSGTGGAVTATGSMGNAIVARAGAFSITGGMYKGYKAVHIMKKVTGNISGGTFKSNGTQYCVFANGWLTISGGTFVADNVDACLFTDSESVVTITGGSFTAGDLGHFNYYSGKLDLSGYNTTDISNTAFTDLLVYTKREKNIGDSTIKLPSGYGFYKSDDTSKTTVTTLAADTKYGIKSTSGGTTTDTATITGVSIEVKDANGNDVAAENSVYTIKSGYSVTYTVSGTNLDKATENNAVWHTIGRSSGIKDSVWVKDSTGTTASRTFDGSIFTDSTSEFEIKYSNDYSDGGATWIGSGVKLIYKVDNPAVITGVSITVDGTEYTTGNVTITPTSTVTLTVTGTNLNNGTIDNSVRITGSEALIVAPGYSWTFSNNNTVATRTLGASKFVQSTTALEIQYTNDRWTTRIDTGIYVIYQSETTSVDITWGSMSFTYSDEQVNGADKGWTCESGANTVKVENKGTVNITAEVKFEKNSTTANITNVTGTFDKSSAILEKDKSESFTLTLTGKPDGALDGVNIGTVTVTITKASD